MSDYVFRDSRGRRLGYCYPCGHIAWLHDHDGQGECTVEGCKCHQFRSAT